MKYLVIATKNNGYWDATLYKRDSNNGLFDMLEAMSANEPIITQDNYNVVGRGIMKADNISDIEPIMREVLGFRTCDECGAWVSPQDKRNGVSQYIDGRRYCATCLLKQELTTPTNPKIRLAGYHDTSSQVKVINADGETFDLLNVLGLGIEMEYNHGRGHDSEIKCTEAFYRLANPHSRNRVFRCEEDGTVAGEIISNIFTKKSLYVFNWRILTDELELLGNNLEIANVGFHVHLSKLWLGSSAKEQCLNFLKLQYFLKSYENDFLKMSGRKHSEMEWCGFFDISQIERMKAMIVSRDDNENPWWDMPCDHHGSSALINSGATIELRIGKSTNDPEKIKHYLRFILGVVENIKNVPFEKCYCIGKVTKLVPSETMNYWRLKGCFLNTNAIENRGVSINA